MNLDKLKTGMGVDKRINADAVETLLKYPWPGNIRELQNIVERLVITTSGDVITDEDIFIFIKDAARDNPAATSDTSLASALEETEREIFRKALARYGSTRAIARVLQISQPTVVRKLGKYGLRG